MHTVNSITYSNYQHNYDKLQSQVSVKLPKLGPFEKTEFPILITIQEE